MPKKSELHCTICTNRIPEGRDRRQTATCSEKCKNQLDQVRADQRAETKCTHCLHPSTPDEREEYRQWRAARRREGKDGPGLRSALREPRDGATASRRDLARGLKQACDLVERLETALATDREGTYRLEAATQKVHELRKLLTPPPKKEVNSSASGTTATEKIDEAVGISDPTNDALG